MENVLRLKYILESGWSEVAQEKKIKNNNNNLSTRRKKTSSVLQAPFRKVTKELTYWIGFSTCV